MSLKDDIINLVNGIFNDNMVIDDINFVPDINTKGLTFGLTGKRFQSICLFIDMRGSTAILEKHNSSTVIKIHKAYFIKILKIVRFYNDEVRSFNGDSILAFFQSHNAESIENAVKSEYFSEKLKRTIYKYKNQALTNAEVVEELFKLAIEIKAYREEEKKLGLSDEELAFYDALVSDGVKEYYEDDTILKRIAHELTKSINANKTVDWNEKKSAQAKMRSIIKRLPKKYDYPPQKKKHAMEIVMRQVNLMSEVF